MTRILYRLAAIWTGVGLVAGLYYRTLTNSRDFSGQTQLSVSHTHSLALGMLMMLVLFAISLVLNLNRKLFSYGIWTYTASLVVTVGTMIARGTMQVLGTGNPESAALAGVSGLGHMGITAALVMIFLAIGQALKEHHAAEVTPAVR